MSRTVRVSNLSGVPATGVVVDVNVLGVPAGTALSFSSLSCGTGVANGAQYKWTVCAVPPGGSASLVVSFTIDPCVERAISAAVSVPPHRARSFTTSAQATINAAVTAVGTGIVLINRQSAAVSAAVAVSADVPRSNLSDSPADAATGVARGSGAVRQARRAI